MVIYRWAELRDIPKLTDLRVAYLREDMGEMEPGLEQEIRARLPAYFDEHLGRDLLAYAAQEDGAIISTVFLIIVAKPASPQFPSGKTGIVLNVYTCPEFRRQGHSAALLRMAIADAGEQEVAYLELKATTDGLPLYRRLGFEIDCNKYTAMKHMLK